MSPGTVYSGVGIQKKVLPSFSLSFNFVNFQVLFYGKGVQETKARALARQLAQLNGAWVGGARAAEACGV